MRMVIDFYTVTCICTQIVQFKYLFGVLSLATLVIYVCMQHINGYNFYAICVKLQVVI